MLGTVRKPSRVLSHTEELRWLPEGNSFIDAAERAVAEVGGLPVTTEAGAGEPQPSSGDGTPSPDPAPY
jgi:hypothetical protein